MDEGQIAPDFTAPASGFTAPNLSLSALRPAKVVLYFYPKDDTPGCTRESIDFTALAADFAAANTRLVGISRDSLAKHEKFAAKHDLGTILVSDEDGAICEAYGTWVEKSLYGRTHMGIERSTFLIDAEGKIARIWRKVKVEGHAAEALAAAQAI